MTDYCSDDDYKSESDIIKDLTIEDFLNHPETEDILETNFFEKVKETISDNMELFYKYKVEYANESFMNIFDKDKDGKMSYDFFLTIYPFIAKSYDMSIFEKFPFLAKSLFIKNEDEKVEKKENVVFQSNIHDWGAIKN
jgi:hypothetical protein